MPPPALNAEPRRFLVAGNWKMNGTRAEAEQWAAGALESARIAPDVDVAVFPPFVWIEAVAKALGAPSGPVGLGGQQCHRDEKGAHTGAIAARMLFETGCRFVLVGHSEVRAEQRLDDAGVRAATDAAVAAGLRPIVCLGERQDERDGGTARDVVVRQVDAVFGGRARSAVLDADVAYEPVWAIGTGKNATPEQAGEAHRWIRERLDTAGAPRSRILYGGSVSPANIGGFLSQPGVDGVLVGGTSLVVPSFRALVEAAQAAAGTRRRS